ncbi:putative monosaccharide-P-dolichol utilization protein [Thermoascus aurantiacus ATCC 26904]
MDKLQAVVLDPLKPYLVPITKNLPEPVNDAIISLIGRSCHRTLLIDLDVTEDPECTSLAISKALGLGIVSASAVVKVPQIVKLINSCSAAGVSFTSYALETASLLITLSYGIRQQFPFSTYGESAFIAVQDVVVGILVLTFGGKPAAAAAWIAVVAAGVYALLVDPSLVDAQTMAYLQAGAGILGVASKAPQIFTIWREGSTGQLSAFAVFNYLAGSLSRIFTTVKEVDDPLILYGYLAGFALNLILAAQMLYYWKTPAKPKKKAQAEKAPRPVEKVPVAESTGVAARPSGKTPTTRRRG